MGEEGESSKVPLGVKRGGGGGEIIFHVFSRESVCCWQPKAKKGECKIGKRENGYHSLAAHKNGNYSSFPSYSGGVGNNKGKYLIFSPHFVYGRSSDN